MAAKPNQSYHIVGSSDEATATARTVWAILCSKLGATNIPELAVSLQILNTSDTALSLMSYTGASAPDVIVVAAAAAGVPGVRNIPASPVINGRIPLKEIWVKVGADNKAFTLEVMFE